MSATVQESALHIGCLRNHYLVPAEHQSPEQVRSFCEAAIASALPHSLTCALENLLPSHDPGIWFIQRLDVDFAINTEVNLHLANIWAREIAGALLTTVQGGEDDGVLCFPNRAAYLAGFLIDLVENSAWSKWYYGAFDGLRMLPASAAVRTAICDSPETGLQALSLLSESKLGTVVGTLGAADSRSILARLAATRKETDETACFQAIAEAWPAVLAIHPQQEDRRALLLFLAACRRQEGIAGPVLRSAATAVASLARDLQEGGSQRSRELLAALRESNLAALYRMGFQQGSILAPFLRCPPEFLESILRQITGEPLVNSATRRETRFTAFGGAFLLLPLLNEFPFEDATSGWPALEDISAPALARFLVLAKCFGQSYVSGYFRDPLMRDLMQAASAVTPELIADWLKSLPREALFTFLQEVSKWYTETGAIDNETLFLASIDQSEASPPVAILVDHVRALWVLAWQQNTQGDLFQGLSNFPQPAKVVCCQSLWRTAQQAFPEMELEPWPDNDASDLPSLNHLADDLAYLSLPEEFSGACAADLALSVAAQGVLRLFAYKLPGFARSSLKYLHRNFLDCCAAVEEAETRRIVCLGRPPLNLILGMAGLNRCTYSLRWLDGPCAIFPEG